METILNKFQLNGRIALVTGCSSGIGLASDAALYVHGTVFTVDGGWMCR